MKEKRASSQQQLWSVSHMVNVGSIVTALDPWVSCSRLSSLETHLARPPICLIENTWYHTPSIRWEHTWTHPIHKMRTYTWYHTPSTTWEHTLGTTPSSRWEHTLGTTPRPQDGNTHLVPHPVHKMGTHLDTPHPQDGNILGHTPSTRWEHTW